MRNLIVNDPINLKGLRLKHKLQNATAVDIRIGYDDRIYILLSEHVPERIQGMFVDTVANTRYHAIVLTLDWENGELIFDESYDLGVKVINYHFIQPIKDNILLVGSRCYNYQEGPEKNATIVSYSGEIKEELCLGDGIENCIVTEKGHIITSYFDEGVFGNYGWSTPIGNCGLIVWDENGSQIWRAPDKYCIYDCYALNIDEKNHIWFYYYNEFNLVKTDLKTDIIYKPEIEGANNFLITKDQKHIIMDSGYGKHSDFVVLDINVEQIKGYSKVEFIYKEKPLLIRECVFRSAKAVLEDNHGNLYALEINNI